MEPKVFGSKCHVPDVRLSIFKLDPKALQCIFLSYSRPVIAFTLLNYHAVTNPDLAFAASVVSQFMSAPTIKHWATLEQILSYLKGAPGLRTLYSQSRPYSCWVLCRCWLQVSDSAGSKINKDLRLAIVSLMEDGTWYCGKVTSKVSYLDPVQNSSTKLCHSLHVRLCAYIIF